MKLKYLILSTPILYYLIKYFLYKINIKLVFKNTLNKIIYEKNRYKQFIKKFYNYNVYIDNLKIRCETEYLDAIYIKHMKKLDYITIYFHGNSGTIYDCLCKNEIKNILSYSNLFVYDYRGYGESTGLSDEKNINDDALLVYIYVMKTLNYDPSKIIIYGNSLGGYIGSSLIVDLKKNNLPIPKGLIMQSTFYSLIDICKELYPWLVYLIQFNFNNSENIKKIKNYLPIIILHSKKDEYIKFNHSEKLFIENSNEEDNNFKLLEIDGLHDRVYYDKDIINNIKNILKI